VKTGFIQTVNGFLEKEGAWRSWRLSERNSGFGGIVTN
jgi:hypothetical protein